MTQPIDGQLKEVLLSTEFRSAITTWNRLEGRPRRVDFDRSLREEIRDALWMICRQWQFGEFNAEDAGSAIKAKTQIATSRLNRFAGRSGKAVGYDADLPLETRVEREPVHLDLMTRAQMGRHWIKLLAEIGDFKSLYVGRFGFIDPVAGTEEEVRLRSDPKAWQTFEALKDRMVDGDRLIKAIRSDEHEVWLASLDLSLPLVRIIEAAADFDAWFHRVYSQPDNSDDPTWSDSYLEYQFACSAPADEDGDKQTLLVAEQYHHGLLDWYAFDLEADPDARLSDRPGVTIPATGLVQEKPISFIPNPIEFGGMPNVRWWEFEDRKIDFGNIQPSTSDLATLMLAEFGLIYGNEWSLIPYVLEVGTISHVQGVIVTDVFGVRTVIRPASAAAGGEQMRWGMYYLSPTQGDQIDTRLFLPAAVTKLQEGAPLERVILARDEMANMVWGIEDIVPSMVGGGTSGYEAATDLRNYLLSQASQAVPAERIATNASIQYKLGTGVPENWIPFVPVHKPGSNRDIRLQRAAMPRLIPGAPEKPVEPRGAVLRPGLDEDPPEPYFLHEEEVLRAGTLITRTYQRVRWWDGKIYTWLGRRKQTGIGQGSSGLKFNRIMPIENDVL